MYCLIVQLAMGDPMDHARAQYSSPIEREPREPEPRRRESEDVRRRQLIEATIDSLAEVGFNASTLAQIARRAGV